MNLLYVPGTTRVEELKNYDTHEWYFKNKWTIEQAAEYEFVPTSTHRSWMGKYRCMHCTRTGYTWDGCRNWPWWWGLTHGINCRKRPPE